MWQTNDSRAEWVQSKHIYLGEQRILTKYNSEGNNNTQAERERIYYYHSDHLGSAQTITNHIGQLHERIEYTPYGELWIDWKNLNSPGDGTPFRFTGKELDAETGLYYYGARYLDPRTSRWLGVDPAMYQGDYIPSAPIDDEARKRNQNLPGVGGIFNYVNLHVYHYGGNNPVMYVDPDGRRCEESYQAYLTAWQRFMEDFNPYIAFDSDGSIRFIGGSRVIHPVDGTINITVREYYSDGRRHSTAAGGFSPVDYKAPTGTAVRIPSENDTMWLSTSSSAYRWDSGNSRENYIREFKRTTFGVGFGLYFKVYNIHSDIYSTFAHLNPNSTVETRLNELILLARAASVSDIPLPPGTQVGEVGDTGHSTGPHLHLEQGRQ